MVLPTPPSYQDRIPNDPFFTPITNTLVGDKGELIVGNGLYVTLTPGACPFPVLLALVLSSRLFLALASKSATAVKV